MIIDHIGLEVSDYEKAKKFYQKALAPIGIELVMEVEGFAGFGAHGKPEFWLHQGKKTGPSVHIAFVCENREKVKAFYHAAIKAGGVDNGSPGIREIYHPNYFGAFVLDPDGHNIEAVCHLSDK